VQRGPSRLSDLERLALDGEIGPETLFWKNGMADWTPGFLVPELASLGRAPAGLDASKTPAHHLAPGTVILTQPGPRPRTSPMAFACLVLSLLWLCGIGSLAAIILGVAAIRRIARSNGALTGKGLAIAGMIVGILGVGLTLLAIFFYCLL
jgi:hypothetical protein